MHASLLLAGSLGTLLGSLVNFSKEQPQREMPMARAHAEPELQDFSHRASSQAQGEGSSGHDATQRAGSPLPSRMNIPARAPWVLLLTRNVLGSRTLRDSLLKETKPPNMDNEHTLKSHQPRGVQPAPGGRSELAECSVQFPGHHEVSVNIQHSKQGAAGSPGQTALQTGRPTLFPEGLVSAVT